MCGEHLVSREIHTRIIGSSPRVWGTSIIVINDRVFIRFIPTCVGNILYISICMVKLPVHPHVCGEHLALFIDLSFQDGSSPRVWGTYFPFKFAVPFPRFIPTCVGNISSRESITYLLTVHPHVCGEHNLIGRKIEDRNGSSPRVWGTSAPTLYKALNERFIPTCVGNIGKVKTICPRPPVHPHVCGEHASRLFFGSGFSGSSPRVWGTCFQSITKLVYLRFIPTCVGNIVV